MQLQYYGESIFLKVVHPNDASQVLDFYKRNQEHLNPWEPDRPENFYTEAYQKTALTNELELFMDHYSYRYYVYQKDNPDYIAGCVCLSSLTRGSFQSAHIAYKTDHSLLRQGISSEAVSMLIQIAFDELRLHRLVAYIHPDNFASIQFIENFSFLKEGLVHDFVCKEGQWTDHWQYALLNR